MSPAETIAVRLPNPLGDVVAATALLRLLRSRFPAARIVAIGSQAAAELLAGLDSYDSFEILRPRPRSEIATLRREADALRRSAAGTVVLCPNSWSSALAARLAGVPRRVGRAGRGRGALLTDRLPPIGEPRPMTDLYLELAAPLAPSGRKDPQEAPQPELAATPDEEARAQERLRAAARAGVHGPFLAVAPGASFGTSKVYPPEQLAAALRLVRSRSGLVPLLLGAPSEARLLAAVAAAAGPPLLSTHGDPAGPGELKALLRASAALLTMDTGARAVAAVLGVPQGVLVGPTDPRWSAFARERTLPLRRDDLPCSPCHLRTCPVDQRCLRWIAPEEVAQAVAALLARWRGAGELVGRAGFEPATSTL